MKRNIEHEIDQTMNCLSESDSIQVSDLFIDAVSGKISGLHTRRGIAYRSRAFYPVIVLLMVGLNLAALLGLFGKRQSAQSQSYDPVSVMASEYGIGESSYSAF